MTQPKASSGWRTCGCVAAALVFVALLIVAGGALWYFFLREPEAAQGPVVRIASPTTGSTSELNQPIQVNATAEDSAGVMRIELYADGALVAVQETTLAQGSNPLVLMQDWTPLTTNRHILLARAYNRAGKFSDSNVVLLDVVELLSQTRRVSIDEIPRGPNVPLPSLNQISQMSGVPVDRLRQANPGLTNTDPNVPLPGGTDLEVPRTPAPPPSPGGGAPSNPPRPLPGTPAAPTNLTGTGDCATVLLTWADSPEEERYVLYRIAPGGVRTSQTLPQNTTSFRDTLSTPGTYTYQVAAVRGALEGFGNLFTHNPTCASPAPPPETMDLLVTFLSIETQTPNNAAWCYVSVNGSPHERVPYEGLVLAPDSREPRRFSFWQVAHRGLLLLPRHPVNTPVTLSGIECIGQRRTGGATMAVSLGTVNASHPRADWNGAERVANSTNPPTGESFRLRYRIGPDTPQARRQMPDDLRNDVRLVETWIPFTPIIPEPINLRYNPNGREACDQIPADNFVSALARVMCQNRGLPTITWEWRGNPSTIAGFSVSIDYFTGLLRTDPTGRAVFVPSNELARVSRERCGQQVNFSVAPFLASGALPASAQGSIQLPPCPTPPPPPAMVEVIFETLEVGGSRMHRGMIEDDDWCLLCVDREMELNGSLALHVASPSPSPADIRYLRGSGARSGVFAVCQDEAQCISQQGVYSWSGFYLANTFTGQGVRDNNILRARVPDGATLTVAVSISDLTTGLPYEQQLVPDPYCIDHIEFPARSAREWATINETRTISQDYGEASCRITFRVRGSAP